MKFVYHRGNNFGDKLNPYIFERLIPEVLKSGDEKLFVGIGSILGFSMVKDAEDEKIVFSSGWGYGEVPEVDESWTFICVRGPLTAELLNIDASYAIADGAILLYGFDFPTYDKKYKYSYMPHEGSLEYFDWNRLCSEVDINFISPRIETEKALKQILESEVLISEAMHGAIVADTLRVPWIPVKAYGEISEFKWTDWARSVNVPYEPVRLLSVFNEDVIKEKVSRNLKKTPIISQAGQYIYKKYQKYYILPKLLDQIRSLKEKKYYLSEEHILEKRYNQLMRCLESVRSEYGKK